jgi:hypothetical protein
VAEEDGFIFNDVVGGLEIELGSIANHFPMGKEITITALTLDAPNPYQCALPRCP